MRKGWCKARCCRYFFWLMALQGISAWAGTDSSVPILAYHRFGATVQDSMTVRTATFESNLRYLQQAGFTVIPLQRWADYLAGKGDAPPPKSVVITVDDGHRSVYEEMRPLVERYRIPVTLFIYPSAISNAPYAMTWEQLQTLQHSGLFDIQSHTYWHPNFKNEKRRLAPDAYREFVRWQLTHSKQRLEQSLGRQVDLLAWPFGIYDEELMQQASSAGYVAAFTLEARASGRADKLLALPRYLMVEDSAAAPGFARLLSGTAKAR